MENVRQITKNHNNYVNSKKTKSTPSCNCRKKDDCPMNGSCLINNVIHKCTVSSTTTTTTTKQQAYVGLAKGEQKQRYYNHRQFFRNAKHKNETTLSTYLWELKKKTNEIPKTIMVNTENSVRVFKHFKTMYFVPTRKAVYCHLPLSRGVMKQTIGINIKMPS